MAEDTKETPPSQQKDPDADKKPAAPVPLPPRPVPAAQTPPKPATAPPRPPQPPAAQPAKGPGRRTFIKALVAVGAVLAVVPFVPWGNYLLSSVSVSGGYHRQKVVLDNNTATNRNANGAAAGKTVNVKDLASFPPNGAWLFTYPSSGDVNVDSQSPDTFQKYALIRLPQELGGSQASAAAFVAYSKVCVHLWCSPSYDPQKSTSTQDETYQCPCHGSIYQLPVKDKNGNLTDAGKAIAGPASLQAFPTNAIPMLTLTADSSGDLYVGSLDSNGKEVPPIFDVEHDGVIGYGRDYASYQNYILPLAEGKTPP